MARRDDPNGDRFFALATYRRDGTRKSTPIWLAPADGRWYAYTPGRSWKVRRLRRDGRVEVAPSDFDGEPQGAWHRGRARVLPSSERRVAKRAMTAKYGNRFRMFVLVLAIARLRRGPAVGVEIVLEPAPDGSTGPLDAAAAADRRRA